MKIKHVNEIIECIKDNPKIYLSENSADCLLVFLSGYTMGLSLCGMSNELDRVYCIYFPKWLQLEWIVNNIDSEFDFFSFDWSICLSKITRNQEEAFVLSIEVITLFYKYYFERGKETLKTNEELRNKVKYDIERLILLIKIRPRMYMTNNSIKSLYNFINGYFNALIQAGELDELDGRFYNSFSSWLDQWILTNKDEKWNEKTVYWDKTLEKITESKEEAFNLFFDLSEQFFKDFHTEKVEIN